MTELTGLETVVLVAVPVFGGGLLYLHARRQAGRNRRKHDANPS